MKTRRRRIALGALLAGSLLLQGCSGGSPQPPAEYRIGEDSLPSLTAAVPLEDGMTFSESTAEDGAVTYRYAALSSGQETMSEYVETLTAGYDCHVLQEDGAIIPDPDLSAESGEADLGISSAGGEGTFLLRLRWEPDSCSVTPVFREGERIQAEPISVEEAVQLVEGMDPKTLGLQGESAAGAFTVYPEEGVVMVDRRPCFRLNAYWSDTHQIAGTYLVTEDGAAVYRLDRETGEVRAIDGP